MRIAAGGVRVVERRAWDGWHGMWVGEGGSKHPSASAACLPRVGSRELAGLVAGRRWGGPNGWEEGGLRRRWMGCGGWWPYGGGMKGGRREELLFGWVVATSAAGWVTCGARGVGGGATFAATATASATLAPATATALAAATRVALRGHGTSPVIAWVFGVEAQAWLANPTSPLRPSEQRLGSAIDRVHNVSAGFEDFENVGMGFQGWAEWGAVVIDPVEGGW